MSYIFSNKFAFKLVHVYVTETIHVYCEATNAIWRHVLTNAETGYHLQTSQSDPCLLYWKLMACMPTALQDAQHSVKITTV